MSTVRNIVFDCNESILDLTDHHPRLSSACLVRQTAMRLWFQELITYSQASDDRRRLCPLYRHRRGGLGEDRRAQGCQNRRGGPRRSSPIGSPPCAIPGRPGALRRLKAAGFHLFTLTDNTAAISGRQLTHGGLVDLFDQRFSVDDTAKRHKPAPEAYAEVTQALGASPSEMCLVACHTWDTLGAQAAGWEAGLIKRSTTMSWIPPLSPCGNRSQRHRRPDDRKTSA